MRKNGELTDEEAELEDEKLNEEFMDQEHVDNDFMGQKHKIDLTFSEAKMMTRNDILGLDSHEPDRGELAVNKPITTKAEDVISANKPKPKG